MQRNKPFTVWWQSSRVSDVRRSLTPTFWFRRLTAGHRPLPDFIIAGAQKAGTTSLHGWLQAHPQCMSSLRKEVHFFDRSFERGVDWYRTNFPMSRAAEREDVKRLSFESSPYYMFDPRVPGRMRELLPNTKVIFLLRDPVTRAYSHYHFNVRRRHETLGFEQAIAAEPQRLADEEEKLLADPTYQSAAHKHFSYLSRGIYADQLNRWLDHFPLQQLLVIQSEQMFGQPRVVFRQILDFLGIDPWEPAEFGNWNSGSYRSKMPPETQQRLAAYFAPHNERLFELLGTRFDWCKPSGRCAA